MKKTITLFFLLAGLVGAEPEFVGYMATRESGRIFAIVPAPGAQTRWVKLEGSIDGYSVAEYRASEEVLVLKKEGRELRLKLKEAKVRDGAAPSPEQVAIIDATKAIVSRIDRWDSEVSYQAAQGDDGFWYVFATKLVQGKREVRRVRVTAEGKATNYSKMTVEETR